jgi:hypothetical protein
MRATSDSGVGDSGRSNTLSELIFRPPLADVGGGGDRQRYGSGEVGLEKEGEEANRPKSELPNAEGGGDRVSERR